jgi:hypothetical protein
MGNRYGGMMGAALDGCGRAEALKIWSIANRHCLMAVLQNAIMKQNDFLAWARRVSHTLRVVVIEVQGSTSPDPGARKILVSDSGGLLPN